MSDPHMSGRQGDPAIKWLVGGTLAVMGAGIFFLMFITSEIRNTGPSGAMAVLGIAVAACAAFGAVAFGPVGKAIGKRILSGGVDRNAVDDELHDLRLQVDDLRAGLAESQERLDFTERMLAGGKERAIEELH